MFEILLIMLAPFAVVFAPLLLEMYFEYRIIIANIKMESRDD